MKQDLWVRLSPRYPIRYRAGFDAVWPALTDDQGERDRVLIVIDARVAAAHPRWDRKLPRSWRNHVVSLAGGERAKAVSAWRRLHDAAVRAQLDRRSLVIAVGGGSIGDLAGFFAATHLRGIDWCPVATTALSMADSAVGGKTAINLGGLKNMVGSFHQPVGVYGAMEALASLSARQLRSGMAEVIKSALLGDARLFARLEREPADLRAWSRDVWVEVLSAAAAVKVKVVQRDPHEQGARALLNLGHTVGHALESTSKPRLLHGEAVALGTVVAMDVSRRRGLADDALVDRVVALLRRYGLPTTRRSLDWPALQRSLLHDKKTTAGRLRMVLTEKLGSASFGHEITPSELRRSVRFLREKPPL